MPDERYAEVNASFGSILRRLARGCEADSERRRDLPQEIHIELWRGLRSLGGGPGDGAKAWGVTSPGVLKALAGPAYLALITPILGFCWFAFWHMERKVESELEELVKKQSTANNAV